MQYGPERLAALITDTVRQAHGAIAEQMQETLRPLIGGSPAMEFLRDQIDVARREQPEEEQPRERRPPAARDDDDEGFDSVWGERRMTFQMVPEDVISHAGDVDGLAGVLKAAGEQGAGVDLGVETYGVIGQAFSVHARLSIADMSRSIAGRSPRWPRRCRRSPTRCVTAPTPLARPTTATRTCSTSTREGRRWVWRSIPTTPPTAPGSSTRSGSAPRTSTTPATGPSTEWPSAWTCSASSPTRWAPWSAPASVG